MLIIEQRCVPSGVCLHCEDSGVVLPMVRKLLTEPGVFCDCPAGTKKWEAVQRIVSDVDNELAALSALPPVLVRRRPFGEPSQQFSAG
ncbi:MAG: hypothetical protein ACREDR_11190 [Blastocatellia bacterium]